MASSIHTLRLEVTSYLAISTTELRFVGSYVSKGLIISKLCRSSSYVMCNA